MGTLEPMVRIGTSGWVYRDWRGRFYPEGIPQRAWLRYYASQFDTVELNATTYRLPAAEQVNAWCEAVPSNFKYTVKLSRLITHRRRLIATVDTFIENYFARTRCFEPAKLGQILVQFPPYLARDDAYLHAFLGKLPSQFRYVVEFRHASWFADEVRTILCGYNVAFCIHDYPRMTVPHWVTTPDLAYMRFHGHSKLYAGSYPLRSLEEAAGTIRELERQAKDVYVYFNNDTRAAAPKNALTLRRCLLEEESYAGTCS